MAEDRDLPTPPGTPFGGKRRFIEDREVSGSSGAMLSDRMAMAHARGKVQEFMDSEIGQSPEARQLAQMMMGFMGMQPGGMMPVQPQEQAAMPEQSQGAPVVEPSPEVVRATMSGDIKGLAELLRQEHERRTGVTTPAQEPAEDQPQAQEQSTSQEAVYDKETFMQLVRIAKDQGVSVDWLFNRALSLYVRDYKATGRL